MKRDSSLCVVLGLVTGLAVSPAMGAEDDFPKKLSCSFTEGTSWSYDNSSYNSKSPQPLSFHIEDIDLEGQAAVIKTAPDAAAGKLSVVRAINANHFIEVVTEGFLNLTTVYDLDSKAGKHPAVHSRHFGLLGSPVFGQYTGFCTAE